MFGFKFGSKKNAEPEGEYVIARLNARVQPIDRGDFFEDPLGDILRAEGIGDVTGGGTQLADEPAGIEFCDLEILLNKTTPEALALITEQLERLGVPKGSKLIVEAEENREILFGTQEGLAVFINGVDLPDEVYESCPFDEFVDEMNKLMGEHGAYKGHWNGSRETGVYCYGPSFEAMKAAIEPFVATYPLCAGARVEQIA